MRSINLDYLRTFVDVIELGSFSAAAERLNLSQPAVSLQIRQLEKRVGVSLIERVGRKARPTAAGSELLDHARQIDAVVAAALDGMARHAKGVMGRLRLGTGATACIFLLPPVLRDLRRRFPTLEIIVSTGNTADIVKGVAENAIDIGFVTMPASKPSKRLSVRDLDARSCHAWLCGTARIRALCWSDLYPQSFIERLRSLSAATNRFIAASRNSSAHSKTYASQLRRPEPGVR
jgi:DNA-binding transcriptional LysR family regulator